MLINQIFEIDSCDDAELGIKRTSKLEYRISYDDEKEIKAIVFIIGGYGANSNISFLDFDREYVAKKFDVVTVNVFYHCFCMRRSDVSKYDANAKFLQEDLENLSKVLIEFNIDIRNLNFDNALEYYHYLDQYITTLKLQGELEQDYQVNFTSTFVPPNGDYQNFGIMAAIDHINVLKDLIKKFPNFKNLPKIYGGGSYGGYLSLLIAKIAPWYVDAVIDNSGSALPPLRYIIGRDLNSCDYVYNGANALIGGFLKTHWTRKENSPYFFSNENYIIRSLLHKDHLILQSQKNQNIIYVNYHGLKDLSTPAEYKVQMCDILKMLGYDTVLHLAKDESDIDGRFIKSLEHGLRMTNKALFRKELPLMLEKLQGRKSLMQENSISYPCGNKVFTFKDMGDKFELVIIN
ncbi:DUF2920 family protein [Campylobacter jejuni]|nr:DUF2920 family protein [Campylobacter jejuni]